MQHRHQAGLLILPLLLFGGCAVFTPTPGSPGDPAHQALLEVRAAVADHDPVPGPTEMLAEVQLVTFPVRRGEETRRDTLRGAFRVAEWLDRLAVQTAGLPRPFALETREVLICEGAAVERGAYTVGIAQGPAVSAGAARSPSNELRYLALWRPVRGEWRLEGLWLSPGSTVRANALADRCQADPTLSVDIQFGAGFGVSSGTDLGEPAALLEAAGYGAVAVSDGMRTGVQLWGRWGLVPGFYIGAHYSFGSSRVSARDTAGLYPKAAEYGVSYNTTSAFAEAHIGPVSVAAGPTVIWAVTDYEYSFHSGSEYRQTATETLYALGVTARSSLRVRLSPRLRAVGSVGYTYLPELLVKAGLRSSVNASGLNGFVGLEWVL